MTLLAPFGLRRQPGTQISVAGSVARERMLIHLNADVECAAHTDMSGEVSIHTSEELVPWPKVKLGAGSRRRRPR